ncbi:MAG: Ubiquinone biosynthesis O-methyltransferase [Bacteroidia bacterium]|nr:Ubiquinone biosynthesis O-methyltransferase [Bacteroidia bacterium]
MSLPTRCPLCAAASDRISVVTPHVYGDGGGRAFFRCGACEAIFLHPGLSPEEEHRFYAAEFEGFMKGRSGDAGGWTQPERHIAASQSTVSRRMRYLKEVLPPRGRVLEVGCSSGFMLYPLIEAGYDCVGIEPSGVFRDYLRARQIACHDSLDALRAAEPADGFDAIMHFFVLEHIAGPEAFLRAQLDLLRPGGVLVCEVPNAADALVTVYDIPAFERFYWSVAHHWYFTEASLGHLLRRLGCAWELRRDQRYDLSNHMVWARDGKPGGMGRFTPLLGTEIEDAYRQALIRSGHCDTLVAVLKKEEKR